MKIVAESEITDVVAPLKIYTIDAYCTVAKILKKPREPSQIKIQNIMISAATGILRKVVDRVSPGTIINFDLLNLEFPLWLWIKTFHIAAKSMDFPHRYYVTTALSSLFQELHFPVKNRTYKDFIERMHRETMLTEENSYKQCETDILFRKLFEAVFTNEDMRPEDITHVLSDFQSLKGVIHGLSPAC